METWNKVQVILKEKSKKHNKVYDNEQQLAGILKYPVCGVGITIDRSTTKRSDGSKRVIENYCCGNWKNKCIAVCNANAISLEKANAHLIDKVLELVNDESILRKVVNNINKNK